MYSSKMLAKLIGITEVYDLTKIEIYNISRTYPTVKVDLSRLVLSSAPPSNLVMTTVNASSISGMSSDKMLILMEALTSPSGIKTEPFTGKMSDCMSIGPSTAKNT